MANYSKTTNFGTKDTLPTGDSQKIIRGSEFDTEFDNIATAITSKLDSPASSANVNFLQSGATAVSRTAESKLKDVVSVKDFGAVGNGVADDTAAIQAAIDVVFAAGGGTVFIPRGTYLTGTLTLKSHVHLVGEERAQLGANGLDKASCLFQMNTTGDLISTVTGTTTYNCGVHNLAIKGKGALATSGRGIFFSPYVTWSTISNCNVQGFADEGVFLSGTANQMSGCFVGANTRYNPASLSFYKGQLFIGGTDIFVTQNEVSGPTIPTSAAAYNGWPPTNPNLYCCAVLVQTASSFITRNVFEIADIGMVVISKHIDSTSFSKTDPYYPGACHSNHFLQNRCDYNFGHGIKVVSTNSLGGPYFCSFIGNHLPQNGLAANNTYDGINIEKNGAFYPYNNIYTNNQIFNSSGLANNVRYGINSDAFSSQNTTQRDLFSSNRARSVATAATNGVASNDHYEESTFTPTITFTTPGDLTAVYNVQTGRYTRIGDRVFYNIVISATTFTHTTASGNLRINGLPYTAANVSDNYASGSCSFQGYTAAGYTSVSCMSLPNNTSLELIANGSGVVRKVLAAADVPSGSNKYIMCSGHYDV
ncbi:MAG: hypothetical protein RL675_207 [Bacteroidota bacterium]